MFCLTKKILISVVLKGQALWKSLPFKSQGALASCIFKYLLPFFCLPLQIYHVLFLEIRLQKDAVSGNSVAGLVMLTGD